MEKIQEYMYDTYNFPFNEVHKVRIKVRIIGRMRTCQLQSVGEVANPAGAVNGRDERRISCAAIDNPARFCSAVIKACKHKSACTPSPILGGGWLS